MKEGRMKKFINRKLKETIEMWKKRQLFLEKYLSRHNVVSGRLVMRAKISSRN